MLFLILFFNLSDLSNNLEHIIPKKKIDHPHTLNSNYKIEEKSDPDMKYEVIYADYAFGKSFDTRFEIFGSSMY